MRDSVLLSLASDPFSIIANIKGPFALAAFTIAAIGFYIATRLKQNDKNSRMTLFALASFMLVIALVTIVTTHTREPYRVHALALDQHGQPLQNVRIEFTTSIPGVQASITGSGTEFAIDPAQMPKDGQLRVYASAPASFLTGQATIVLAADHNPTLSIPMTRDTSAQVRGFVEAHQHRISEAIVSVVGFESEAVHSDSPLGGFSLPAHAGLGQTITLHAEAPGYPALDRHAVVSNDPVPMNLTPP